MNVTYVSLLHFAFITTALGIAIDNGIVGDPVIGCMENGIHFEIKTQKPFAGRIYSKGKVSEKNCTKTDFVKQATTTPSLDLTFGNCGMRGMKSTEPDGMFYAVTLVVSFHPQFVTKVDKAFFVKCFFAESKTAVKANIDVSMIPTTEATAVREMTGCTYSIHKGTLAQVDGGEGIGPPLQFAQVGDKILHRWDCPDPMFGLVVRDCFVSDGFNETASVIDGNGCPVDPILISAVKYSANLTQAYAESHVFKFADQPGVYFSCQIQHCLIMSGGCSKVTPPGCAQMSTDRLPIGQSTTKINSIPLPPLYTTRSSALTSTSNKVSSIKSTSTTINRSQQTTPLPTPPLQPYGNTPIVDPIPQSRLLSSKFDDDIFPPHKTAAGDLLEKIAQERENHTYTLKFNDSSAIAASDDQSEQQLTGRLIIFDIDEIPPSSEYRSRNSNYTMDQGNQVEIASTSNRINNEINNVECIISSRGLSMLLASLGGICVFLCLLLFVICLKFRRSNLTQSNASKGNYFQENQRKRRRR